MNSRKRAATDDLADVAERPNALIRRTGTAGTQRVASPNSQRAARCLQHVRALNSQFASWVQQQLRDNPDCLWKEGVSDYLKHSTTLLDDFKDVVEWMKSNPPTSPPASAPPQPFPPSSLPPLPSSPPSPPSGPPTSSSIFGSATATTTAAPKPFTFPASTSSGFPTFAMSAPASSASSAGAAATPSSKSLPPPLFPAFTMSASAPAAANASSAKGGAGGLLFSGLTGTTAASTAASPEGEKKPSPSAVPWVPARSFVPPPLTAGFGGPGLGGTTSSAGGFSFGMTGGFGAGPALAPVKMATSLGGGNRSEEGKSADQQDEEEEEKQPESPSIKSSVEKGVKVEHSVTSKLYVKEEAGSWKDMGKGELSIRRKEDAERGTKEAQARILLRTDVGKLLLNANLYQGVKATAKGSNVLVMLLSAVQLPAPTPKPNEGTEEEKKEVEEKEPNGDGSASKGGPEMRMYLLKVGSPDRANELSKMIVENAPNKGKGN